ncbi:MAG: PDDEXK nuclease domain-containing protein, partial [Pseudomonadota bacterium]
MRKDEIIPRDYGNLLDRVAAIFTQARVKAIRDINLMQVVAYYEIGREIVEYEQAGKRRAGYGEELIVKLAEDMTGRFGRGFSERNLRNMRALYLAFPIRQTLSAESESQVADPANFTPSLSWSHYCELLKVDEPLARSFYEKECSQNNWSVREMKRQINAMLFERLALSKDSRAVMRMAREGQIVEQPEDAIKDPYILEFLNLKEETAYTENQLEQALIDKLQSFLLELGKGFSFVARQKRITIANRHYYIDLVFYNRLLRCFVLIDLKRGEFDHADAGQMNFYLNYYRENEKQTDENDPIGLILCAGKDDLFARYVLGGLTNKVFASKYKLALPSEKELRQKLGDIRS